MLVRQQMRGLHLKTCYTIPKCSKSPRRSKSLLKYTYMGLLVHASGSMRKTNASHFIKLDLQIEVSTYSQASSMFVLQIQLFKVTPKSVQSHPIIFFVSLVKNIQFLRNNFFDDCYLPYTWYNCVNKKLIGQVFPY